MLAVALYFLSAEVYLFSTPTCPEFIIIRAAPGECASRNSRRRRGLFASPEIAGTDSGFPGAWRELLVAEHLLCQETVLFILG